jgi:hypothetical protein
MTFCKIDREMATIEVPDLRNLKAAWKTYGGPFCMVRRFIVGKKLTDSQLRRLPEALRARLHSPDGSVEWLEHLYRLEDPRN